MSKIKIICFSAILFLISFFVYIMTTAPSVYFGDSGELITAIFMLGLPHPTGFPLYMLIGKIFTNLPLGDIAFRINILSSFFASLTIVILFLIFLILNYKNSFNLFDLLIFFAFSSIFIFSFTFWSQAVIARIYTMNAFFCSLLLMLFLYYNEIKKTDKILFLSAFLTGLGAGIHLTFLIFAFFLWIYILIKNFKEIQNRIFFIIFLFFLGLSVYFYIIIRGTSDAILNWHKLQSIEDFFYYITQKQYKQKMFSREFTGYSVFLKYVYVVILREFTPFGLAIFLISFIFAIIKKFKYTLIFFIIFISNILLLAFYGNYSDLKLAFRYFIPSYIICFIFIFYIFNEILVFFKKKNLFFFQFFIFLLLFFIAVYFLNKNFKANDKSNDFIPYFYPADILSSCEKKSYLFITGDNQIFTIAYFKYVKNKFNDITIFDTTDTIFKDINTLQKHSKSMNIIPNILTAINLKYSPLFTAVPTKAQSYFEPINGIINKISEKKEPDNFLPWLTYSFRGILYKSLYYDFEEREVVGTYLYRFSEYYKYKGRNDIHFFLLEKATNVAYDSVPVLGNAAIIYSEKDNKYDKAEELLKTALKLDPENESLLFNLGSLHATKGEFKLAIDCFNKVISRNPLNFNARIYLEHAKQELERNSLILKEMDKTGEHFEKGKKLLEQKKYNEALTEFENELKKNPSSAKINFHIALCYSLLNEIEKAIPYYELALRSQPENISILNNLGLSYLKLNNKESALKYFEKSLEIDKNQPKIIEIINKNKLKK